MVSGVVAFSLTGLIVMAAKHAYLFASKLMHFQALAASVELGTSIRLLRHG